MSWKDKLLPASFRGVGFSVFNHDSSIGGRRVQIHSYPGRNRHLAEDLGLKPSEFTFEAFVLGDDYIARRDRMIEACAMDGPASLVHPYLGSFKVVCTDCRVSERTEDGRMARHGYRDRGVFSGRA
jgi:prophage DNA circulation protein